MKILRPILVGLAIIAVLGVVIIALALSSSVQTWAARRALAGQKDMKAGIGRVSAGLNQLELTKVTFEKPGMALTLPSLTIEMPLVSAASKRVAIRRLIAKGWKVDLTEPTAEQAAAVRAATTTVQPQTATLPKSQTSTASPVPFAFDGLFKLLRLPVDFSLDEIDVEGEINHQAGAGQPSSSVTVRITGGKLLAGGEGRFNSVIKIVLADTSAPVSEVTIASVIVVQMDTPRTFEKFSVVTDVKAVGTKFPQGVDLHSEFVLSGGAKGESYLISLQTPLAGALKNLFSLDAAYPAGATTLSGKWKLDLSNTDVAPFTLGLPLPVFAATGEGVFEADRTFAKVHASGRIDNTVEQLTVFMPELAALGRIRTQLDFDLSKQGDWIKVERFAAAVSGVKPIASVQALQKFEYNLEANPNIPGHPIKVADPSVELLRLTLHGLPLAWVQPFIKDLSISGDDVRGEFFASARNGGFAIRPSAPVTLTNLAVSQGGKPLVRALDIAVKLAADSTQQGWQADISEFSVRSGATTLLNATAKAGQPAGADQPVKATGQWDGNLPALLAQPVLAQYAKLLSQGAARGEFTASLDKTKQISATLELNNLTAPNIENLPRVQASARLDLQPDGRIDAQVPLVLEVAGRKSDLELTAHVQPGSTTNIEAEVLSNIVYVQDLKPLQALAATLQPAPATPAPAAPKPEVKSSDKPVADKLPFWSACTGQIKLALKEIVYSPEVKVSNVTGTLKIEAGSLNLDGVRAGLGDKSEATLAGHMTFDPAVPQPYSFTGVANVSNFDPAPYFRAADPSKPPTVEGRFDVAGKFAGTAQNTATFANQVKAEVNLTSRGGVFRGLALPSSFAERFQGKSGNLISSISGAVGALDGSKTGDVAQAAVTLVSLLSAIPFDQLNTQLTYDAAAALTKIDSFTLISPTIRLTGTGSILQQEGVPFLKQPLTAQIEMSVHGETAELLGRNNLLSGGADSLGYAPLFSPIKLDGTCTSIGKQAFVNLLTQKLLSNASGPLGNLFGK